MENKFIKIFGARRTGTNYLNVVLSKSFIIFPFHFYGHKHNIIHDEMHNILNNKNEIKYNDEPLNRNNVFVVISIKNPYAWILSIIKWAKKNGKDPKSLKYYDMTNEEFIIKECKIYNDKYKNWIDFYYRYVENCYIFLWENSLFKNIDKHIEIIKNKFGLPYSEYKDSSFVDGNINAHSKVTSTTFNRDYYINMEYMDKYTPKQLKLARENIDWSIFNRIHINRNLEKYYTP